MDAQPAAETSCCIKKLGYGQRPDKNIMLVILISGQNRLELNKFVLLDFFSQMPPHVHVVAEVQPTSDFGAPIGRSYVAPIM
jgi:hypothetical protein